MHIDPAAAVIEPFHLFPRQSILGVHGGYKAMQNLLYVLARKGGPHPSCDRRWCLVVPLISLLFGLKAPERKSIYDRESILAHSTPFHGRWRAHSACGSPLNSSA